MKIVFLSRFQNEINRGAENFVNELAQRLSKKYQVEILVGKDADSIAKVVEGKYDIAIPINGRLQSLKASLWRLAGRYKVVITGHSGMGIDDIWNITVARPNIFVALTDHMAKWAKKWAWGTKVVKIPNGVDLDKFSPNGLKKEIDLPRPVILSVGALVMSKYHDRVIKAVSSLANGSVLIAGEGEEKGGLEKLGVSLLSKRFKIIKLKYKDMPNLYRSVDLFTLPSWSREAFGIVYLEAMATGLGIVAPDDLPRREIIGDAGIFVDVSNPLEYAQAIEKALQIDWSQKARMQAEKFSWDKITKQYEEVFERLL